MKNKKVLLTSATILIICLACIFNVFAHSGRTDGSGGHRDNNNSSGLGSYHYHCGGYPAHLHTGGVCPYTGGGSYSSNSSGKIRKSYETESKTTTSRYSEGYEDGYDAGYDFGYDRGYDSGHADGYVKGYNDYKDEILEVFKFLLISIVAIIVIVLLVIFIKRHRKK